MLDNIYCSRGLILREVSTFRELLCSVSSHYKMHSALCRMGPLCYHGTQETSICHGNWASVSISNSSLRICLSGCVCFLAGANKEEVENNARSFPLLIPHKSWDNLSCNMHVSFLPMIIITLKTLPMQLNMGTCHFAISRIPKHYTPRSLRKGSLFVSMNTQKISVEVSVKQVQHQTERKQQQKALLGQFSLTMTGCQFVPGCYMETATIYLLMNK